MVKAIEYGDRWANDKLKREDEAKYLTSYLIGKYKQDVSAFNDGSFVLNVNAEWGFGKTYFLKNWADNLSSEGHPIVYFDAWQNDFSNEPLLAIIATINAQLQPYFSRKIGEHRGARTKVILSEWYETGKKLINPSSPLLLGILAKKFAGMTLDQLSEYLNDDTDNSEEKTTDEVEETVGTVISKAASQMLASHNSTKKTILEFKNNLGKLTNHLKSLKTINLPMFIFIDELDRCRPNYAVELLENIKHLFGVHGVFFVVATASEQLCHSIKSIYGQSFDSPSYLKRFFDQTYTMQSPDRYSFSEYLFEQYNLTNRENLFSPLEEKYCSTDNPIVEAFALMSNIFNSGLRDMMQHCVVIDSISLTFTKAPLHLVYLLFLIILREKHKMLYDKHVSGVDLTQEDLLFHHNPIELTIQSSEMTENYIPSKTKISAMTLVETYLLFSKMNLEEINKQKQKITAINKIKQELMREMPSSCPADTGPRHLLSTYPTLIEQAGRIT